MLPGWCKFLISLLIFDNEHLKSTLPSITLLCYVIIWYSVMLRIPIYLNMWRRMEYVKNNFLPGYALNSLPFPHGNLKYLWAIGEYSNGRPLGNLTIYVWRVDLPDKLVWGIMD